jgi:hypothetical protein
VEIGKRKVIAWSAIFIGMVAILWIGRYPALYYYFLWRLNHTTDHNEMLYYSDAVDWISPHVVPLLVRTYKDVNASDRSRLAAGLSLVKVDKGTAEALSIKLLESRDSKILSRAIFILAEAKSIGPYRTILKLSESEKEEVRLDVVHYLGKFNNPESISMLRHMNENDPSNEIRTWASYYLHEFDETNEKNSK